MTTTETLDALAPYNELRAKINELAKENAAKSFDYTKPAGIKAAKSHIHVLRGKKADVERVRKAAKADALEYGRKVDTAAKELTAEIEGMIDLHNKPLEAMEQREAARKTRHEENMLKVALPEVLPEGSEAIKAIMEGIALTSISESWEEYEAPARKLRDETLQALADRRAHAIKREDEAAELERHRREAAERERAERESHIAAEAAEKARREAEEAAARKAEEENRRREEDQRKQEAAAKQAEERRAQEMRAEATRKADTEHRSNVLGDVVSALAEVGGVELPVALLIAAAIDEGRIPHVSMQF